MTYDKIALRALLEKGSDATFLRAMIGFAAERLVQLETEALCGAAPGERSTDWVQPAQRLSRPRLGDACRDGRAPDPEAAPREKPSSRTLGLLIKLQEFSRHSQRERYPVQPSGCHQFRFQRCLTDVRLVHPSRCSMTRYHDIWHTEKDGVLASDNGQGFRLTVASPVFPGGKAQFTVTRRDYAGHARVVGSGAEGSVREAMRAAAQLMDGLVTEANKRRFGPQQEVISRGPTEWRLERVQRPM